MKAFAAVMLALSGAVIAVASPADDLHLAALADQPVIALPTQQQGGVAYLNGGAGVDEMGYLKSRSRDFPLQVLFSGRGGEYIVADSMKVTEGRREIATINDAGPMVMLRVPPGRYTIEAHFGDLVERRNVDVGSGVSKLNWNSPRASE